MWEALAYAVISLIISYAVSYATRPKPQTPTAGNLDVPTPDPGANVGVVFGTNVIKYANVIWYGDPSTRAIKTSGGKK